MHIPSLDMPCLECIQRTWHDGKAKITCVYRYPLLVFFIQRQLVSLVLSDSLVM